MLWVQYSHAVGMVNICGDKVKFHALSLVITITDTFGVREMRCVHIIVVIHRLMCNSVHHMTLLGYFTHAKISYKVHSF